MIERNETHAGCALEGAWSGSTDVAGRRVALVLHVARGDDGWTVHADFPQLHRNGMPFSDVSIDGGELRFRSRSLGAFEGRLADDGGRIDGLFRDDATVRPIALQRGVATPSAPARPQQPQPPFDYAVEDVFIDGPGGCLAGTLTTPRGRAHALALLVPGSGAMDRDETVFDHKPFLVLADHLARHGYASLRLDDRGVGASTGDRLAITVRDEADDQRCALEWLAARADLHGVPIGLIGHSMGATVASIVAAECPRVAFLVSMAGAGAALAEVFAAREGDALRRLGADAGVIGRHAPFARALFDELRDRPVGAAIDAAQVFAIAERFDAAEGARKLGIEAWIARYNEPWFRSALRLDPPQALARITAPFLAINGERDLQVPSRANLDAIAHALRAAAHRDFTILELPALNHLFQTCTTGEAYEYPVIEETFAPFALDTIRAWLDTRFGPVAA